MTMREPGHYAGLAQWDLLYDHNRDHGSVVKRTVVGCSQEKGNSSWLDFPGNVDDQNIHGYKRQHPLAVVP